MKTKRVILLMIASLFALNIKANVLTVPAPYSTIQSAINVSTNGDTIAVSPGTYFENINFRGKNILLTSLFYLNSDTSFITSTIINGSTPVHPDTASCVIFNSGEDSTAILQGFTITGGAGTKWTDIHGAGVFREGGGILIELSSPSILHNSIINNTVTNTTGVTSTGGGGIRIGDGNPVICNNLIIFNEGRYGAGIVLNYSGSKISNNIIASNTGGQEFFGGSGIWIYNDLANTPKIIVNNTIINNSSTIANGSGGITVLFATNVILKNNIIWQNPPGQQIKTSSATPMVSYSDIQGSYTGIGNIDLNPEFDLQNYILSNTSPCIDAGDSNSIYNDIEDTSLPGNALFPSKGLLRNDMGAYGGPCASLFPLFFQASTAIEENLEKSSFTVFPNPFSTQTTLQTDRPLENVTIDVYNVSGEHVKHIRNISGTTITFNRDHLPSGLYFLRLTKNNKVLARSKLAITKN